MRWPWQRERIEPSADDVGGGLPQQAAAPPRVPPAGWAFLPPMQRTIENMQLISEPNRFTGALTAWGDPSFTNPMAHLVSTAAPGGIIDVDGGGPVRSDSGFPPSSVEMTLLPPPAPGSRPAPRKAGNAGSLQRSASDGATSAGASGPVGPALTAAAGTFPVLQLYASPPEETWPHAEPDLLPEQAQARAEQDSNASEALPAADEPAPAAAGATASTAIAPTSIQPIRAVGSTSDGSATYVPLPPPAVQRAGPGTPDAAAAKWKVPPASKLGLGMPLAYSEPAGPPESFAAAALRHIPPPVQRSAAPEPSGEAPATPPDAGIKDLHAAGGGGPGGSDGNHDHGSGADGTGIVPISGRPMDGTVPLPLVGPPAVPQPSSAISVQATPAVSVEATDVGAGDNISGRGDESIVGPADVGPSPAVPEREMDSAGDRRNEWPAGGQENHESAMPLEPAVAPLLSAGGLDGSLGSGDQSGLAGAPDTHMGGTSGMLVVSRFRPALTEKSEPEDASGEPSTAAAAEEPLRANVGGAPERTGDSSATPLNSGWRDTAQNAGREPETGQASTPATPASNAVLPLQRTGEPASGHTVSSNFATVRITTPRSYTAPQRRSPLQSSTAPQTPLVFRMARTTSPGSTPDSLQRLTEMPAALQQATQSPSAPIAATPGRAAQRSTSAVAPDALPSLGGYPGPDATPLPPSGLPGINRPEGSADLAYEPAATQLSLASAAAWPVEPLEVTAAVGRSIQRTLASEGAASAAGGGPWSSPHSLRPADLVSAAAGPTAQAGGRGPVNLQRSAASSPAFLHPAEPHVGGSVFGIGAVTGIASTGLSNVAPTLDNPSGPALLALALQPASRTGGDATTQRDAADPAAGSWQGVPAQGSRSVGGPSTAASQGSFDAGPSVQTDAGSTPAGAAQPVPAAVATGPAGKQAAGAPAATPEQLEELAKRLTGPLIRRIKAEMLLDRERRGLRTDVN
jgi:hypothetical protein